jgi:hypothetical protein
MMETRVNDPNYVPYVPSYLRPGYVPLSADDYRRSPLYVPLSDLLPNWMHDFNLTPAQQAQEVAQLPYWASFGRVEIRLRNDR